MQSLEERLPNPEEQHSDNLVTLMGFFIIHNWMMKAEESDHKRASRGAQACGWKGRGCLDVSTRPP